MVIKTTNNNQTTIKQLTELMNQEFDSALTPSLNEHEAMRIIKTSSVVTPSFEEKGRQFEVFFEFIQEWATKSYFREVYDYTRAMTRDNQRLIHHHWVVRSLDYCLEEKTVLACKNKYNPNDYTIKGFRHNSKPSIDKDHPIHNDSIANALLNDYKTFNGTVEEAVVSLIKPLLIQGCIARMMTELSAIDEFIEVINNYNDKNYHLQRFVQALEKGMMDPNSDPFELKDLWELWDEDFMKETVVPFLKKNQLSNSQRKQLPRRLYNKPEELLIIDNYYDYCLSYKYYSGFLFEELEDTLFLYDKKEFEQALRVILVAVENSLRCFREETPEAFLFNRKKNKLFRCSRLTFDD